MKSILYPFLITAAMVLTAFLAWGSLERYFTDTLDTLIHHRGEYACASFLILASDILLPVPSSIVMYVNGYVLGGILGAALSLASLSVGAVIGYYLGKLTSLGLKANSDAGPNAILSRYGATAIILSRGIPILAESICIVCGYNRMPFRQYFIFNLIGYIPLCLLYGFCGSMGYDKNTFLLSFLASVLLSLAFWLFGRSFFPKRRAEPTSSP